MKRRYIQRCGLDFLLQRSIDDSDIVSMSVVNHDAVVFRRCQPLVDARHVSRREVAPA